MDFIVLEDVNQDEPRNNGITDYLIGEEGMVADPKGQNRVLLESSERVGFDVEFTPHQSYPVLAAYRYFRKLTRLQGTINFQLVELLVLDLVRHLLHNLKLEMNFKQQMKIL